MSETEAPSSGSGIRRLWYCAKCTRMITPPGDEGLIAPDGEHYCAKCAPAWQDSLPPTKKVDLSAGSSRAFLKAAQPSAAAAAPAATAKADGDGPESERKRKRLRLVLATAAGVVVALAVGIALARRNRGDTSPADAPNCTPAAARANTTPVRAAAVAKAGKDSGAAPTSPRGDMPRMGGGGGGVMGPSFLVSGDQKRFGPTETKRPAPAPETGATAGHAPLNQTPALDNSLEAFQKEMRSIDENAKKERYGIALQALKGLSKRFSTAPWWESSKEQAAKTEQQVQQQMADAATEAEDARLRIKKSEKLEFLRETEAAWKARLASLSVPGQPEDEQAARPLRLVLKDINDRRAQLAEQKKQSVMAKMSPLLEGLERQLKSKEINLEGARKTIEDLQAQAADCGALDVSLAERLAGMRFDATSSHEAELAFYKAPIKRISGGSEVQYDFTSPEQLAAWTLEDPHDASLDTAKGALLMKHPADKDSKRDTRMLRLPLDFFQPSQWAIEVEAALISNRNKLEYGIYVSDGGGNIVRLSEKQQNASNIALTLGGQAPGKGLKQRPRLLGGSTKEQAFLQMSCQQGALTCTGSTGGRPWAFDTEKLTFAPRFAGLYIQDHDHEEDASVVFTKFRLRGALDLPRMRQSACAAVRKDFEGGAPLFKDWLVLGPFKRKHASPWEANGKLDFSALLKPPPANQPAWQRPFPGATGVVDLHALLNPNENVYAYAAAEVQANQEAAGLLLLGADDGIAVWLDGDEIHRNPGPRWIKVDEDKVPVRLAAGVHSLVLRIDQSKGDWGFCGRLAAADGKGQLSGVQLRCATLPK